jgi:hypothetical protein
MNVYINGKLRCSELLSKISSNFFVPPYPTNVLEYNLHSIAFICMYTIFLIHNLNKKKNSKKLYEVIDLIHAMKSYRNKYNLMHNLLGVFKDLDK